jgi:hypothetical protein
MGRVNGIERNLAFGARPVSRRTSLQRVGRWLHLSAALVGVVLQQNARMALVIPQPWADARSHELHNK